MFKKHALALTLSFVTCGAAIAADNLLPTQPDLGQVEFVGTIIDSPCSITPDTADQTVPMGLVSSAVLAEGNTKVIPFNIELEGCTAEAAKKVSVKFTGNSAETGGNALAIEGTAAGAGIELTDIASGKAIVLGTNTDPADLYAGDNTLQFGARLVKTSKVTAAKDITPGEFTATANFEMSYQ
ncbi:fimbrial protein [Aeromonas sp. 25-248]